MFDVRRDVSVPVLDHSTRFGDQAVRACTARMVKLGRSNCEAGCVMDVSDDESWDVWTDVAV